MYKVNNPDLVKYTVATEWSEDNDGKMQVNQYEVIKELGSGSYGVVYLVRDTKTGNYYAMKELTKSKLRNKNRSTRSINPPTIYGKRDSGGPLIGGRYAGFMRRSSSFKKEQKDPFYLIKEELAICKKLNHRNVTRLYEVLNDPEQDMLYMVIELCEAGPVMKVTLNGTNIMDESNARNYFIQSLLGLEYLHENGIAHRDIKPDNMLLTRDDVLKLSDFGEAYMFIGKGKDGDGGSDNDEIDDDDATMDSRSTGMTLAGTEAFMAPELLEGNLNPNLMPSADIWALGVSLYCFLYDKLPYERCEGQLEIADSIYHKRQVVPMTHGGRQV
ncbi:hypothetical protein EV182_004138 [Spiromyces aspiralis]|uniref:Uncharacterized protein n=1 Tax=Spiromyces aspiralis TaxID=68401 RepID=A0ACC1HQ93_9FUNG|nr:hypothetical protein EV182_004138 [Spiromyces aspiralis]